MKLNTVAASTQNRVVEDFPLVLIEIAMPLKPSTIEFDAFAMNIEKSHTETIFDYLKTGSACTSLSLAYFPLAFEQGPWACKVNALFANLRSTWLNLPFGDQGFFVPKALFFDVGGFPNSFVSGEDHALVQKLRFRKTNKVCLKPALVTSARKYAQHGYLKTTLKHLKLTILQEFVYWEGFLKRSKNNFFK